MERADPETVLVKTCVTCVKFFDDCILAGIGGLLHVISPQDSAYNAWKVTECVTVFESQNIHGIQPNDDNLLVYGGKQVAVLKWERDTVSTVKSLRVLSKWAASDWILDAAYSLQTRDVAFLTANNALLRYSSPVGGSEEIGRTTCAERSILYSGKILYSNWSDLIVLAGTVFSEIIIWANQDDSPSPVLHRLNGHKGVIFSINFDYNLNIICSTSDDRTVRLWNVDYRSNWELSEISLQVTMFGHSARVWNSCFLPGQRIASIGEDSLISVWTASGELEIQRSGHEGGEVRSVDFCEKINAIVTGGNDGGINLWPVTSPASPIKLPVSSKDWLPKCTACLYNGNIAMITNKGEFMVYSNGNWTSCFLESTFESYCIFGTSPGKNYLALASINGWVQIVEARDSDVTIRGKFRVATSRIYSIAWVSETRLVASIEDGKILLLKFEKDPCQISEVCDFELPSCKERWTTCCALKDDFLLCGDRCGSLHLYSCNQTIIKGPVDTHRKIHGFKGVSDVKFLRNGLIISTGRDGTYNQYFIRGSKLKLLHSFKMQIQWPSAIVELDGLNVVILGFHETHFHVWSVNQRCTLFKIDCGGGHRSWDSYIIDSNVFVFAFIKEKSVFYFHHPLQDISVRAVTAGMCPATLNAACTLPLYRDDGAYILFGSEDGTLRFYFTQGNSGLVGLGVARSHISSVRALTCLKRSVADDDGDDIYAVSGGGRGQLIVWKVVETGGSFAIVELVSQFIRPNLDVSKMVEPVNEPEMRYMDLTCLETTPGQLRILGACSDGILRMLSYNIGDNTINVTDTIQLQGCLLKVLHFQLAHQNYGLSASTTGQVDVWDLTSTKNPIVTLPLHKLGVNACDCLVDDTQRRVIIATGCDDASISLNWIDFNAGAIVPGTNSWTNFNSHFCQITGVRLFSNKLVCCGLDQRISVFHWTWSKNAFIVTQISHKINFIPDCHGLLAWYSLPDCLRILVFGEGIQHFRLLESDESVFGKS